MAQSKAELIKSGIIGAEQLANSSITTEKYKDGSITNAKLASPIKSTPFTTRGFNIPL